MKFCELDPAKRCDLCGDCEVCDLDPQKKCNDCCKCIEDTDYNGISIDKLIVDDELKPKGPLH